MWSNCEDNLVATEVSLLTLSDERFTPTPDETDLARMDVDDLAVLVDDLTRGGKRDGTLWRDCGYGSMICTGGTNFEDE